LPVMSRVLSYQWKCSTRRSAVKVVMDILV
jgi:hypothetical protein